MKTTFLAVIVAAACATTTRQGPAARPASPAAPAFTPADVRFMAGMIGHHAQAVLMAGWAPSHDASAAVRALCERVVVGQRDEIALMQRWLRERHEPVPEADPAHFTMPGMDPSMLMPGMLTAEQLAQLDRARGPEFDRLFLTNSGPRARSDRKSTRLNSSHSQISYAVFCLKKKNQ